MITDHTPVTETHAGDWERGYAKGYKRAIEHMKLLGCDCDGHDECDACCLANRLKLVEHA